MQADVTRIITFQLAREVSLRTYPEIGVPDAHHPTSHHGGDPEKLEKILPELMSLKPRGIREHLGLNKPIYTRTSAYGHFGRAPDADGGVPRIAVRTDGC